MGAKKTAIISALAIAVAVAAYAVSPYFTESEIDEPLPSNMKIDSAAASDRGGEPSGPDGATTQMAGDAAGTEPTDALAKGVAAQGTSYAGTFVGVGDGIHDAGGRAYTISIEDGSSVLRLEDFYSTNGPGLRVYLATDTEATDYISLGDLKANRGNQNYDIPPGADLQRYDHVLIWCEPFSVLFGSAELVSG